jgi:hypothetical protein
MYFDDILLYQGAAAKLAVDQTISESDPPYYELFWALSAESVLQQYCTTWRRKSIWYTKQRYRH